MNLKTFGLGAVAAASVVVGSVAAVAPAQALTLNFTGSNKLDLVGGNEYKLRFGNVETTAETDLVFGGPVDINGNGNDLTLKSLSLIKTAGQEIYSLKDATALWIEAGLPGGRTFTLTKFVLQMVGNDYVAENFTGFFSPPVGGDPFLGGLTTQGTFRIRPTSFSTTIESTPIPTPALLPGLVGLGVAAIRKRKNETAEKVEVKA